MSSFLSRSGGIVSGMTLSLKKRSSLKFPLAIRSLKFSFVAVMKRVFKGIEADDPRGSKFCSSITLTSLDWIFIAIFPMSSRKRVPPSARRSFPFLSFSE